MDDHELAADVIGDEPLASVLGHFEYGRKGLGAREAKDGEAAVVADLAGLNPGVAPDRIGEIARPLDRALLKFEADEAFLREIGGPRQAGGRAGLIVVGVEEADLIGDRGARARVARD